MNLCVSREPVAAITDEVFASFPLRDVSPLELGGVIAVDNTRTLGVIVCGQAQAGKSTLKDILAEQWKIFDDEGESFPFANSNGYRGLTYKVLEWAGIGLDGAVARGVYRRHLTDYADRGDVPAVLDELYVQPLDEGLLRNPATNSTVEVTGEDPGIRALVNEAAGRFLSRVLDQPEVHGLPETPGLVVLDTRNVGEGRAKFELAGVDLIGTIIVMCPEPVAARRSLLRKLGVEPSAAEVQGEAGRLTSRNRADRDRPSGPMTLPQDMGRVFYVDAILESNDPKLGLIEAGMVLAADADSAIVIQTDNLTIAEESAALGHLLTGMLTIA